MEDSEIPKPSARADQTEALFKHIEIITGQLDNLGNYVFKDSPFCKALKTKDGENLQQFLENVRRAEKSKELTPKLSKSQLSFISEHTKRISTITQIIDYIYTWASQTKDLINILADKSVDFVIRWNHIYTTRVCQLFVMITKVSLYLYEFQAISIAVHLARHIPECTKLHLQNSFRQLENYVGQCTADPFSQFGTKNNRSKSLQKRLGQLIAQIAPFLIQIFSQWPLCDWQIFAIFGKSKTVSDSSLPDVEHIILSNLELYKETVQLFCLTFPHFIESHPQFRPLMTSVFSETSFLQITRSTSITSEQLEKAFNGQKIINLPLNIIQKERAAKEQISHPQRIAHLLVLLRDIADLVSYNASLLPQFTYKVMALGGFSQYELSIALKLNKSTPEICGLLNNLVQIAKLYLKHEGTIRRFFYFNLATADMQYLDQLAKQFSTGAQDWQLGVNNTLAYMVSQLSLIDLDQIDRGYNYDTTPFALTFIRLLHYFNELKCQQHVAFLHPIFIHLETIRIHMNFANNPLKAFLSYCPLQTYWRFSDILSKYVQNMPGGSHLVGNIITLFSIFNCDQVQFALQKSEKKKLRDKLSSIRGSIISKLFSLMNKFLNPEGKILQLVNINRFDHVFDPKWFNTLNFALIEVDDNNRPLTKKKIDVDGQSQVQIQNPGAEGAPKKKMKKINWYQLENKTIGPIWQMKEFLLQLPINLDFEGKIEISTFIAKSITSNMTQVLLKHCSPNALWLDSSFASSTNFLWPLFALLGSPFPYRMFVTRFEQSAGQLSPLYLDLISKIKTSNQEKQGGVEKETISANGVKGEALKETITDIFVKYTRQFVETDYPKSMYEPHAKQFTSLQKPEGDGHDPFFFFSLESFRFMINNLGLHVGFNLDIFLCNFIATKMVEIFKVYDDNNGNINEWCQNHIQKGGDKWQESLVMHQFKETAQKMIQLGVALIVRDLLRQAMMEATNYAAPGLPSLIKAAFERSYEHLSEKEDLLIEVSSGKPFFHFIENIISSKNLKKSTDASLFFFFFAILLASPAFENVRYNQDHVCITRNLHLYPAAMNGFISNFNIFSVASDYQTISNGMQFFFSVVNTIIQYKKEKTMDGDSVSTFIVLIDMFPYYLHGIEYGRIQNSFPQTFITEAYRDIKIKAGIKGIKKVLSKVDKKKQEEFLKLQKKLEAAVKQKNKK